MIMQQVHNTKRVSMPIAKTIPNDPHEDILREPIKEQETVIEEQSTGIADQLGASHDLVPQDLPNHPFKTRSQPVLQRVCSMQAHLEIVSGSSSAADQPLHQKDVPLFKFQLSAAAPAFVPSKPVPENPVETPAENPAKSAVIVVASSIAAQTAVATPVVTDPTPAGPAAALDKHTPVVNIPKTGVANKPAVVEAAVTVDEKPVADNAVLASGRPRHFQLLAVATSRLQTGVDALRKELADKDAKLQQQAGAIAAATAARHTAEQALAQSQAELQSTQAELAAATQARQADEKRHEEQHQQEQQQVATLLAYVAWLNEKRDASEQQWLARLNELQQVVLKQHGELISAQEQAQSEIDQRLDEAQRAKKQIEHAERKKMTLQCQMARLERHLRKAQVQQARSEQASAELRQQLEQANAELMAFVEYQDYVPTNYSFGEPLDREAIDFGVIALLHLWTSDAPTAPDSIFTGYSSITITELVSQLFDLLDSYEYDDNVLLTALCYIKRLSLGLYPVSATNVVRLLLSSVSSIKFIGEPEFTNKMFAPLVDVEQKDVDALEREFLSLLQYQLHVTQAEFAGVYQEVRHMAAYANPIVDPVPAAPETEVINCSQPDRICPDSCQLDELEPLAEADDVDAYFAAQPCAAFRPSAANTGPVAHTAHKLSVGMPSVDIQQIATTTTKQVPSVIAQIWGSFPSGSITTTAMQVPPGVAQAWGPQVVSTTTSMAWPRPVFIPSA
eukprot:TRINITY_DN6329_c0_g1_i7.p1 TRINITY_DN6329_c0_g1~~TRINITY_DN6329_c0_g1_i7.p1  ORF type:complete len:734 (+),score=188.98 TRINITY_DN6329_c0_g1_i7:104-2305(+)